MSLFVFACMMCLAAADIHINSVPANEKTIYQLIPGVPSIITLKINDSVSFSVTNFKPTSAFLLMQVYAQHASLNLTQTSALGTSVSGNSVGMVEMISGSGSSAGWSMHVMKGSVAAGVQQVSVLALVQEYEKNAPIPGGCNQVFSLENDPNIHLFPSDFHTEVWFQWSRGGNSASCESPVDSKALSYEVYVGYVTENDDSSDSLFDVVHSMKTAEEMRSSCQKIITIDNNGQHKSQLTVTSQRAQGAVYGVVVTDNRYGLATSYVSGITYACNNTASGCSLQSDAMEWVMVVACGLAGLFLLCLGHLYLRTEMAVIGFLATAVVSFTLLFIPGTLSDEVCLAISGGLGIVGALLWLLVWIYFTFPSVSVLLPGLCAGYLLAGAVFFTPFANISWWTSSLNYGLVFTCITLLFPVALLCSPRSLNIISCCLVGGFCVIMTAAIPLRSSLRLFITNAVHHASVQGYVSFIVVAPFQLSDGILVGVWIALAMVGVFWQFHNSRGKPHFPSQDRRRIRLRGNRPLTQNGIVTAAAVDENSPLLGNQNVGNQDFPPSDTAPAINSSSRAAEMTSP